MDDRWEGMGGRGKSWLCECVHMACVYVCQCCGLDNRDNSEGCVCARACVCVHICMCARSHLCVCVCVCGAQLIYSATGSCCE
jgi:hypothetical protein